MRRLDTQLELAEQALAIYREAGDLRGVANAATQLTFAYLSLFRPADLVPILERAVSETLSIENEPEGVRLLSELTRTYSNLHDPRAMDLIDSLLERAERLGLVPLVTEAIINRALVLGRAGRFYESVALLRGVLPLARSHDLVWSQARAINNLLVQLFDDDPGESLRLIEEGKELARRTGNLGTYAYFHAGRIEPLIEVGRWQEVRDILEEMKEADPADPNLNDFLTGRAIFLAYIGDDAAAVEAADVAREALADTSFEPLQVNVWMMQMQVDALGGRLAAAARWAEKGMNARGDINSRICAEWSSRLALWTGNVDQARAAHAAFPAARSGRMVVAQAADMAAIVAALDGRTDDALRSFRQAVEVVRDLDVRGRLGAYLTDLAIALPPSVPGVRDAAAESRQIWTDLGSPSMLARLDAGLAHWQSVSPAGSAKKASAEVETSASA